MQNTFGGQQQQQQQNVINQGMQNYQTAQQYPMTQLGQLKNLISGFGTTDTTTTQQQAAPSGVSQLAGLGTAGLGALGMYNTATKGAKQGGSIKAPRTPKKAAGLAELAISKMA
jgi:hypothetical protein